MTKKTIRHLGYWILGGLLIALVGAAHVADAQQPCSENMDWAQIAFLSGDPTRPIPSDNISDIYLANLDGSKIQPLERPGAEVYPAWSPDGQRLAFSQTAPDAQMMEFPPRAIFVMDVNGCHPVQLTDYTYADKFPVWSPDGEWIAFQSKHGDQHDLYIVNVNDGTLKPLTQTEDFSELYPDWSPDGEEIVYKGSSTSEWYAYIAILNVHTLQSKKLLEVYEDSPFNTLSHPRWSPRGDQIVFSALFRPQGEIPLRGFYLLDLQTLEVQRITELDDLGAYPSWSSDGTQIVFDGSNIALMHSQVGYFDLETRQVKFLPFQTGGYPRLRPGVRLP